MGENNHKKMTWSGMRSCFLKDEINFENLFYTLSVLVSSLLRLSIFFKSLKISARFYILDNILNDISWYKTIFFWFKYYLNEMKLLSFVWNCSALVILPIFALKLEWNGEKNLCSVQLNWTEMAKISILAMPASMMAPNHLRTNFKPTPKVSFALSNRWWSIPRAQFLSN
jgi:hypothetical protein